jgi:hypothetical protein
MRGLRSHAEDYITSLANQSEQFLEHIQDAIEPFIDLEETWIVGETTLILIPIAEIILHNSLSRPQFEHIENSNFQWHVLGSGEVV